MLIVFGALSGVVPAQLADYWPLSIPFSLDFLEGPLLVIWWVLRTFLQAIQLDKGIQTIIAGTLLVVLISGGGICALTKRCYWWALSGAICLICTAIIAAAFWSETFLVGYHTFNREYFAAFMADFTARIGVLYVVPGLLALIFLVISKGQFQKLTHKVESR